MLVAGYHCRRLNCCASGSVPFNPPPDFRKIGDAKINGVGRRRAYFARFWTTSNARRSFSRTSGRFMLLPTRENPKYTHAAFISPTTRGSFSRPCHFGFVSSKPKPARDERIKMLAPGTVF